jgi:hypothetical protein
VLGEEYVGQTKIEESDKGQRPLHELELIKVLHGDEN